jgi:uncharacterized protein (DUF433 family)
MSTPSVEKAAVSTEHIEITPGICGGQPRIKGTRIRVQDIYLWFEREGRSADEIVSEHPHLTLADVFAALAYYWDHRDEIRQQIKEDEALVATMRKSGPSPLQEKLARTNGHDPVSP